MNSFKMLKAALVVSIFAFAFSGVCTSLAVMNRQQALREVSRYNMVWAVSQAIGEFYRFEARLAAYSVPG
ncbi:MAG: hypothetical protein JO127_18260, partial [Caulobacteraceae bacterium]|nr:hypothetical protein [Caulobacteraceae bacterium]